MKWFIGKYILLAYGIHKWILCNNFYLKYKLNTFLISREYNVHLDYWISNIKTYSVDLCINVFALKKNNYSSSQETTNVF